MIQNRLHSATIREALNAARYEAGLRRRVLLMLGQLGTELAREVAGAGLDHPRTDWQQARLRKLLALAERRTAEVYGEVESLTTEEMRGFVEVSADRIVAATNDAIGAKLLQPLNWTEEQLASLASNVLTEGAPIAEWWGRQSAVMVQGFTDQMRMGMMRGESISGLLKRVKGIEGVTKQNAERLVRTSALAANNAAHMAAFEANSDVIEKVEWTSTLDQRTCVVCGSLDARRWPLDAPHPVPPKHWQCRCCVTPITKTWAQLAKEAGGDERLAAELDNIAPADRASMGGPVSGDTTFEGWLKGQSQTTQKEVLGTGKWEVWQRSGMNLNDLVDQRGNELTLKQLRAL